MCPDMRAHIFYKLLSNSIFLKESNNLFYVNQPTETIIKSKLFYFQILKGTPFGKNKILSVSKKLNLFYVPCALS